MQTTNYVLCLTFIQVCQYMGRSILYYTCETYAPAYRQKCKNGFRKPNNVKKYQPVSPNFFLNSVIF